MENETGLSPEIREEIRKHVMEYCDDIFMDIDSTYINLKELAQDVFNHQFELKKELEEIYSMLHQHSIGVQNVYDELLVLKKMYNVSVVDPELMQRILKTKELWE